MSDLVSRRDFKDFHGGISGTGDDPTIDLMLEAVEDALESQTGQKFEKAVLAIVDEPHNGSGLEIQELDRPPAALNAAVKVGQDPADPDDTILVADLVVDQANQRLLYRDGRIFPRGRRNIFVSYDSAANLPNLAKLAVREGTAFLFRRKGAEHVTGQSSGELGSVTLVAAQLARLPAWQLARAKLNRFVFA